MKTFLRLFYGYGSEGNVSYNAPASTAGAGLANNGLSVNGGKVQLGGPSGSAAAATLLNNREIPLAGFGLLLSGQGATAAITIKQGGAAANNPQLLFQDQTGAEISRISFPDNQSTLIGAQSGAALLATARACIMIGNSAGNQFTTATKIIAIGPGAAQFCGAVNPNFCIVLGTDSMDRSGGAIGDHIIIIGHNSYDNGSPTAIGTRLLSIGDQCNNSQGSTIGNDLVNIGHNNNFGGTVNNTTVIGNLQNGVNLVQTSNIIILGRPDQNTLIGAATPWTDNGSRLQLTGSISQPIRSSAVNTTLDATDHTLIATASLTATLPAAASATNRKYYLVAQGAATTITTSINYTNLAGASVNTVATGTSALVQSNGANWIQIK